MGVSKNKGTAKWMVYKRKLYYKMDDLGVPLFLEPPQIAREFSYVTGMENRWKLNPWEHRWR